jgi:hypothetical protein
VPRRRHTDNRCEQAMRSRSLTLGVFVVLWLCMQESLVPMAYAAATPPIGPGWWVVLTIVPVENPDRKLSDPGRIRSAARRCGNFTVFSEPSSKFREFQPGYNIFVVGSFAASRVAEKTRTSLMKCFPNVFVKYGEFVGE